jgi:hypothetical protein
VRRFQIPFWILTIFLVSCVQQPDAMTPTKPSPLPPKKVDWWLPTVGLTWQWHLSELPVDTSMEADVFD